MPDLRDHQKAALEEIYKGLRVDGHDRGLVTMACGAGKTLTGKRAYDLLEPKRTLVLLPSLALVKQTLDAWRSEDEDFSMLAVCSDETVVDDDHLVQHVDELGAPTTTDPAEIARFMRKRTYPRVVFATYHSASQVAQAQRDHGAPKFDVVIADEAHRTTGRLDGTFATVLTDAIRADKRLFFTATPKVLRGEGAASMDDEDLYGPLLFNYPFSQAIEDGILCDYEVLVVALREAEIEGLLADDEMRVQVGDHELSPQQLATQIALLKAMREHNLQRVVTFHSRVAGARVFADTLGRTAEALGYEAPHTDHVAGHMPSDVREKKIDGLRHATQPLVMTNARCLSEGVDVPTLDAVMFADPRSSHVDVVQAIGRAIRTADGKERGMVILPLFVPDDLTPDEVAGDRRFGHIWHVLRALRTHDGMLAGQLDQARERLARGERPKLPPKIKIDAPEGLHGRLVVALELQIVERAGDIQVPVERIRALHADGMGLTEICRVLMADGVLNARGKTTWNPASVRGYLLGRGAMAATKRSNEERWAQKYEQLVEWTQVIGPLELRNPGMERELTAWMTRQKDIFHGRAKRASMSAERRRLLEQLPGWSWERAPNGRRAPDQ